MRLHYVHIENLRRKARSIRAAPQDPKPTYEPGSSAVSWPVDLEFQMTWAAASIVRRYGGRTIPARRATAAAPPAEWRRR